MASTLTSEDSGFRLTHLSSLAGWILSEYGSVFLLVLFLGNIAEAFPIEETRLAPLPI